MDHSHRNAYQTSRNDRAPAHDTNDMPHLLLCVPHAVNIPPSSAWVPRIRGNLQMLPVPTTEPRQVSNTASEDEKVPCKRAADIPTALFYKNNKNLLHVRVHNLQAQTMHVADNLSSELELVMAMPHSFRTSSLFFLLKSARGSVTVFRQQWPHVLANDLPLHRNPAPSASLWKVSSGLFSPSAIPISCKTATTGPPPQVHGRSSIIAIHKEIFSFHFQFQFNLTSNDIKVENIKK